jgi:hypothetical protein
MSTEEHEPRSTRDHSFDDLTKGLASGSISRRQALRLLGGALLGGVLASIPGVSLAQQGPPLEVPPPETPPPGAGPPHGGIPPGQGGTPPGQAKCKETVCPEGQICLSETCFHTCATNSDCPQPCTGCISTTTGGLCLGNIELIDREPFDCSACGQPPYEHVPVCVQLPRPSGQIALACVNACSAA